MADYSTDFSASDFSVDEPSATDFSAFYLAYGKSLAARLLPGMPFVFVEDLDDAQEVMKLISGSGVLEGGYLFCWDNFDEDLDTAGRDNFTLSVTGSFSVLKKSLGLSDRAQLKAQCRQLVLQAFTIMLADAREGSLEQQSIRLDLRQIPLQRVGPLSASWYGYQLQFRWTVPADLPA